MAAPPTGRFKLDAAAFWTGQKVVLTQTGADYGDTGRGDSDATLSRKVSWGDGSSSTLARGATGHTKQYTRAGKFKVTVTITDRARNSFTTPARWVTVTVPGKVSLSKKTVYQGQLFAVKFAAVPAGTKSVAINWGDGWVSSHPGRNGAIPGRILYWKGDEGGRKLAGNYPIKVAFYNKLGASSYRTAGTVKVLADKWKPVVKITKPAKANRIGSWKTVKGTVSDKGAGVWSVFVGLVRVTSSGKAYCSTPKNKWKRYTSEDEFYRFCLGTRVAVSKGKWSYRTPAGLGKGELYVHAWSYDRANSRTNTSKAAKLTRS